MFIVAVLFYVGLCVCSVKGGALVSACMTIVNMEIQPLGHWCYTFCLWSVGGVSGTIINE